MKYILNCALFLLFVLVAVPMSAQDECATKVTKVQTDYMDATRTIREGLDVLELRNQMTIIPLVAHIIRNSDGSGGLTDAQLNIAMNDLNAAFVQVNFVFELCEVRYIDNTAYMSVSYSTSSSSEEYQMAVPNRVPGKVNVFFIQNLQYCGWSSFPSYKEAYDKDWTVMKNSCAINGSTFPHELGHYFNLYHTHQGPSSGIGITAAELVDGSNCGPNVGDELCDTPADPRLSGCVTAFPGCAYTCTGKVDANGDPYTPDTSNLMSYSQKRCRTFFSPQQITRMQQSYLFDRTELTPSCDGPLACQLTSISVSNVSACNDNGTPDDPSDDYFTGDVKVNYFGQPDSGTLDIAVVGGGNAGTTQFSTGSHTFSGVTMPANGQAISITASFSADTNCTLTNANAYEGMACIQLGPCKITSIYLWAITNCQDNGTPNNPTDDFFNAVIRVYNENPPTSGNLVVTGDASRSVSVSQLNNNSYHDFYNVSLPADGTPVSLSAYFSSETSCAYSSSNVYSGRQPCSSGGGGACDVNATITQTISGSFFKEVTNSITASNQIQSSATATYDAGYEITLTNGFDAVYGSDFHGYIDGCSANDNDTDIDDGLIVNDLDATLGRLRNFPNPFDQYTTIEFLLNKEALVSIEIYGIDGRFIDRPLKDELRAQGTHQINFDATQLTAGTYLCRVRTDNDLKVMKMTVVK